jgi:hypothetical protein
MAKDAAATIAGTSSGLDWRVEVSEALHNSLRPDLITDSGGSATAAGRGQPSRGVKNCLHPHGSADGFNRL